MSLTSCDKKDLKEVLELAGDDPTKVAVALQTVIGRTPDRARRAHLRAVLPKALRRQVERASKEALSQGQDVIGTDKFIRAHQDEMDELMLLGEEGEEAVLQFREEKDRL